MGVNDQHWVCISVNCIMVAVFNPNMVRYHQSMIHQHLEAHSPLTEGHHPPLAGGPPLPTHRGYSPSAEGVASVHGVQTPISLEYQICPPTLTIWYSSNWNGEDRLSPYAATFLYEIFFLQRSGGLKPNFTSPTASWVKILTNRIIVIFGVIELQS